MARNRMIKPDFWADEKIGYLSTNARLLYISLWNFSDDEALLRWIPELLKSQAFLYDDVDVEPLMDELVENKFVFVYQGKTVKGQKVQRYAWIVNFHKHQKIDRPQKSKLPPPSITSDKVKNAYFERDQMICHICKNECVNESVNICGSKAPSLDHVKPKSKNGSNYPSNIKTAHISCNKSKKDNYSNDLDIVDDEFDERFGEKVSVKEKDKVKDKDKDKPVTFNFDLVYNIYPKKAGKTNGLKSCKTKIKTQDQFNNLIQATKNYSEQTRDTEQKYIKQFSTFMNCWEDYIVPIPDEKKEIDKEFASMFSFGQKQ